MEEYRLELKMFLFVFPTLRTKNTSSLLWRRERSDVWRPSAAGVVKLSSTYLSSSRGLILPPDGWMGSLCELLRPRAQIPHALCRTRCAKAIRLGLDEGWSGITYWRLCRTDCNVTEREGWPQIRTLIGGGFLRWRVCLISHDVTFTSFVHLRQSLLPSRGLGSWFSVDLSQAWRHI